jgi:hypothetical protein
VDLDVLDPTSRAFAADFLRHHPRLSRHARTEPRPGGGAFLVLTIPAEESTSPPLVVDTGERDRVLVQWGRWSREFDAPAGGGRSSQLADALSLVEDLLSGAARTYVVFEDGRWRGAGVLYDEIDERRLLRDSPAGRRIEVRSWTGEHQVLEPR